MFSRASSISNRLRKSKSTNSVRSRRQRRVPSFPGPVDPDTFQLHALTAASLAMQRASNRSSADTKKSFDGFNSHGDAEYHQPHPPKAELSGSRDSDNTSCYQSDSGFEVARARGVSSSHDNPAPTTPMPVSRESKAPVDFGEFGMLQEDNLPSLPSSYRRLRKTKSMFSTKRRPTGLLDGSHSRRRSQNATNSSGTSHLSRRSLRRSMSFFGEEKGSNVEPFELDHNHEAALQLARKQFSQDIECQRTASNANGVVSSVERKPRPEPKPFRKTVRPSASKGDRYTSNEFDGKEENRGSKTRGFSLSIRKGLRRMFGRPSDTQEQMPIQQVNAENFHGGDSPMVNEVFRDNSNEIRPNTSGRPASILSMRSCSSIGTSNSRVTSWTDSTAAGTVTSRQPQPGPGGRLTIIDEDGDSQYTPTPSSHRHHDGYSVFRQPFHYDGAGDGLNEMVDSQRVYSALMKKIDRSRSDKKLEIQNASERNRGPGSILGAPMPNYSQQSIRTIKPVPSERSMNYSVSSVHKRSPDVHSQFSTRSRATLRLTPQQIASYNEGSPGNWSKQSLRESRSSFFSANSEIYRSPQRAVLPRHRSSSHPFDDSGSVIVSRGIQRGISPESPSVYSRTTSGHTPPGSQVESDDETGTATILTSHRLPYKPRGTDRSNGLQRPIKGSAEWKSWMSSQMDLIDTAVQDTTLNTHSMGRHYREDAQINSDETDEKGEEETQQREKPNLSMLLPAEEKQEIYDSIEDQENRPPLTELRSVSRNNFSRPLRHSPSGQISICSTTVRKPSIAVADVPQPSTPTISNVNARPSPSTGSLRARSVSRTPTTSSPLVYNKQRPSEACARPKPPPKDTPTGRSSLSTRNRPENKGSPVAGLYASDNRQQLQPVQFNSMQRKRDRADLAKENRKVGEAQQSRAMNKANCAAKLGDIHSTISTKRMVDLFLSDRRRTMGGSEDGPFETAFL